MKSSTHLLFVLVLNGTLATAAFAQMSKREMERIDQGKITKTAAQHLVLQRYPDAKVKKCELRHGKSGSVWRVDLMMPASKTVTQVEVDGKTGEILTPPQR